MYFPGCIQKGSCIYSVWITLISWMSISIETLDCALPMTFLLQKINVHFSGKLLTVCTQHHLPGYWILAFHCLSAILQLCKLQSLINPLLRGSPHPLVENSVSPTSAHSFQYSWLINVNVLLLPVVTSTWFPSELNKMFNTYSFFF